MWFVGVYKRGFIGERLFRKGYFGTEFDAQLFARDNLGLGRITVADIGYVPNHPVEVENDERLALLEYDAILEDFWGIDYDPENFDELSEEMDNYNEVRYNKEEIPF